MKKIFKVLAITAASTALCAGIATATGCGGSDGEYIGYYCYANEYNAVYGVVAKVTVKNNIIQNVEDVTHTYGDGKAFTCTYNVIEIDYSTWTPVRDDHGAWKYTGESKSAYNEEWHTVSTPTGNWTEEDVTKWYDYESWLLQQYIGKSVADVLAIPVYFDENGEVYGEKYNPEFAASGLVLSGSTQGSGRVLLAVQNALK